MFDIQTELHLRNAARDSRAIPARPWTGQMLLILASLMVLTALVV